MWNTDLDPVDLKLLERNIIDIRGEVDEKMALHVREALRRLVAHGSPDITVTITSGGGSVTIGLDIYDALRLYPGKKTGQVFGFARSIAAVILQACDLRQCARYAHLMLHHVTRREVSLTTLRDKRKLQELVEDMERNQTRIYSILVSRSHQPLRVIKETCKKETEMTAEEAKEFGLVDEVI